MSDKSSILTTIFTSAAVAIAIDLLLVFPISHTSMIGTAITKWSGGMVVPPLDWLATNVFGMKSAAMSMAAVDPTLGAGITAATIPPAIPTGVESTVVPTPTGVETVTPPADAGGYAPFEEIEPVEGMKSTFNDMFSGQSPAYA